MDTPWMSILLANVGDPDPHVFGPPGSGSGPNSRTDSDLAPSFSHKGVEQTEIMLIIGF
jgi:hypothetical protein